MAKKKPRKGDKRRRQEQKRRKRQRTLRGEGGPPIVSVDRNVPVVEDGYRVVGPAQAMMDYAGVLMEHMPDRGPDAINVALQIAQVCWNLAIEPDEKLRQLAVDSMKPLFGSEAEEMVDVMVNRHRQMFPELGQRGGGGMGVYIKEKVIDAPKEFVPFDESKLQFVEEPLPRSEEDEVLSDMVTEIDGVVEDGDLGEIDALFDKLIDAFSPRFTSWCAQKGVEGSDAEDLCFCAERFINYVYGYTGETLSTISSGHVDEFVTTFFIRKTSCDPGPMSGMPAALKLLAGFLAEQTIATPSGHIASVAERKKGTFLKNLREYQAPGPLE